MRNKLPSHIKRLFWGDDLNQLDFGKHADYIIQTVLEHGGVADVKWLFKQVSRSTIKKNFSHYHLTPKSANFWKLVLSKVI